MSHSNKQIHCATEGDAPQLLALQKAAFMSEAELHNDFDIPPLTQTVAQLKQDIAHKSVLKMMVGNELVASGQAQLIDSTCHIGRMAVWPEQRGKGYGSQLFSALEGLFPSAERYELFTGVHSQFNLAMYSRRGYIPFKHAKLGNTEVVYLEKRIPR